MKYPVGTVLIYDDMIMGEIKGVVVENVKLPGDICVLWEGDHLVSYDEEWLDEHCGIKQ